MGVAIERKKFIGRGAIDARGGLYSRGVPIFGGGIPAVKGNVYHVDSGHANASDSNEGTSADRPLATIDAAVGKCTANNGDLIIVSEGHAETINTAAGINLDQAGVTVKGLGIGEDRPTVTVGSSLDSATVVIAAADVRLLNLIFQPGNDGVDVLLDVNADGAVIEDCELRSDEANAYQVDTYIDINGGGANAADRCTIRGCKISSPTAGAVQGIEIGAVEDAVVIEGCWIDGDFTAAGIHSGSAFTNSLIAGNVVANRNGGNHAIELSAAATGLLVDNRMYGNTLGTILDPGSMMCLGNLETDAIDQAGVDSPRVSAGGFPDDSITAAVIATGAIDADAIADNAIDAGAIAAGAIAADAFAAGAIDAAAIANAAIDAATFAADALQAMQDEAQDAIQGENLDHLAAVTTVAADMTAEVVDGSVIARILSKVAGGDTSSYDPTTDALEMASDKLGAFSGDGGAAQDDSAKASLDLAHTDLDAIIADIGNPSARANFASLETMIGIPDAVNSTVDDMIRTGFDSSAIGSSADGSVMERQEFVQVTLGSPAGASVSADIAALPTDADVNAQVDAALDTIVPANPTAGSLNDVLSKAAGGNTFLKATDSLEMLSDKLGAFSGDGGAAQDDSAKASLDLAHTMLGGVDAVTTDSLNGKLGTDTELADRSLYDILNGGGPAAAAAAAAPANDISLYGALRAIYNLVVPAVATGEADIDIDQADYTSYQNLMEIAPAAGAPLSDAEIVLDLAKAAGGFNATHAAETVQFAVARKVDGVNWRIEAGGDHESTAISGTNSAGRAVRLHIGSVGETEDVRIYVKLSAENAADVAFPFALSYKALAAPTVTPVAAA